jgi:adenylate kinase
MALDFDTIFIAGPQGSGKGTQAEFLCKKLGFLYLTMGGMFREILKQNTNPDLVQKILPMNQGILLPDETVIEVLKDRVAALAPTQGIVFDGVPRRIGQANFLLDFLQSQNRKPVVTLFINLPREESVRRLMLRAEKEKRADDTLEGINTRLDFYEKDIKPTMDYLKGKTRFFEIDGAPAIDVVEKSIDAALGIYP